MFLAGIQCHAELGSASLEIPKQVRNDKIIYNFFSRSKLDFVRYKHRKKRLCLFKRGDAEIKGD
ncbi:MAG: hypothetical protein AABY58_10280, partial [Nitrospirota bacterium]